MIALSGVRSSWDMFARNCRLVLRSLGKLAVRFLQFLEQSRVLDGDDGLVREHLQECDILAPEGANFVAADGEDTDNLALTHERRCNVRSEATPSLGGHRFRVKVRP